MHQWAHTNTVLVLFILQKACLQAQGLNVKSAARRVASAPGVVICAVHNTLAKHATVRTLTRQPDDVGRGRHDLLGEAATRPEHRRNAVAHLRRGCGARMSMQRPEHAALPLWCHDVAVKAMAADVLELNMVQGVQCNSSF